MDDNTDKNLNPPLNNPPESAAEELIHSKETLEDNPKKETETMEVHAQDLHKVPGQGWKHYFFEFVMLFLAVFCGFLAENYREQLVDKHREKQFLHSLAEDLKIDTMELQRNIYMTDYATEKIDSLILFIKHHPEIKTVDYDFIKLNVDALPWFNFALTDRTSSQLKYGGNMRLIDDIKISNDIIEYWHMGDVTVSSQERLNIYRAKEREVSFKLFRTYDYYLVGRNLEDKNITIDVRPENLYMLDEMGNYLGSCGTVMGSFRANLIRQHEMADSLLSTISR